MARLRISQILEEASELPSKEDKIDHLRRNDSVVLRNVLRYALDPSIEFLLPKGKVPYRPSPFVENAESVLYYEARRLYLFVKGGNDSLKPVRREQLFIELLESLDPRDAELLVAVKDKKLPYKGLNSKLIKEAFPGLVNEQVTQA